MTTPRFTSPAAVLAVDGGNSKTDVALVGADGSLLASVRGPGLDAQHDGVPETVGVLGGLVAKAAARAGHAAGDGPVARHLSACVANADLPEEEERVAAALRERGWASTVTVANDTFAVLRAGLPDDGTPVPGDPAAPAAHWGVGVTCGAGINCVGVAPDGRTWRFLSLGNISGDWGGGWGLGDEALWHAIRDEDGRGEPTALRGALLAHFGTGTLYDVAVGLHRGTIEPVAVAALVPAIFACAAQGDRVARDLIARQADEVGRMVLATVRHLDLTGLPVPVVLGGGVLAARDPLLTTAVTGGLAVAAPAATVTIIDVAPVAGAALLGLDEVAAGPAACARLRAAFR